MKKYFRDIDRRLLVTKPVLWVSSMHWILGLCSLIVLVEVSIGLIAKPGANLTVFYTLALLVLIAVLFLWISFQYRNYDKIFTIRQTFRIYLYNILSYIFICISSLLLVVIMHFRFDAMTTPQQFSKDLLAVRIANLRNSDVQFIVRNPQLFTSKGVLTVPDTSATVDLQSEYITRDSMNELNPLIKSNISPYYNTIAALRDVTGFEYLDSVLRAREEEYPSNKSFYGVYSGDIDEDPIFYKYMTSLSQDQLDSIHMRCDTVTSLYGLSKASADFTNGGVKDHFIELTKQVDQLVENSQLSDGHIFLTIIFLMVICSITFNFILTKNILCLFTPFIYLSLLILGGALFYPLLKPLVTGDDRDRVSMVVANVLLLTLLTIVLRWRRKLYNKSVIFFVHQVQNLAALGFFIILFIYAEDSARVGEIWKLPLYIIAIAGFLITHYFFIRKMHHTLIQEI